ncbi:MAG: hypothetical protein SynsKO_05280 [Synoicihabitans sp.]
MIKELRRFLGVSALALSAVSFLNGFDPITDDSGIYVVVWARGSVPIQNNLPTSLVLSDGTNFRSSMDVAIADWNAVIGNVQLDVSVGETGSYSTGNDLNEIVLDDTIDGFEFGDSTLAVAVSFTDGGNYRTESDIIFNDRFEWDSYRGPLRDNAQDIRRVAIHEMGHVLGLDHPDQANPSQSVTAVMNSTVSDTDGLRQDDIDGGQFLYGAPSSPPVNDDFSDATLVNLDSNGEASFSGNNIQSSSEAGEPVLDAGFPGGRSVWWKWTADANGILEVSTEGSRFDTILGVFVGDQVDGLRSQGVTDDIDPGVVRTSRLEFLAQGGTTYYFMVDGWDGLEGAIELNVRKLDAPPPAVSLAERRIIAPLGQTLTLSASAEASIAGALSYQWYKDNQEIPGATGLALDLENVTNNDTGAYTLRVFEMGGSIGYATAFVLPNYRETQITSWGIDTSSSGADQIPSGLTHVIELAAGRFHGLALRSDGTVVGWGGQTSSQLYDHDQEVPPSGLNNVVAIAAGQSHSLALKADGTVVSWGGQSISTPAKTPPDLRNVIAIAADNGRSFALLADGSIEIWDLERENTYGNTTPRDVVAFRPGFTLHSDGLLRVWDGNFSKEGNRPDFPALRRFDGSLQHVVGLGQDGRVYGIDYDLGGSTEIPDHVQDLVDLEVVGSLAFGIKADGSVIVWGESDVGQDLKLTMPSDLSQVVQVEVGALAMALQVGAAVVPPSVVSTTAALDLVEDDTINLSARVVGDGPFTYVWRKDGVIVTNDSRTRGAGTSRLIIDLADPDDAGGYTLTATNAAGESTSSTIDVTVAAKGVFTVFPLSQVVVEGERVDFTAEFKGTGDVRFQWFHNGQVIAGANQATFAISSAALSDSGRYAIRAVDDIKEAWTQFRLNVAAADAVAVTWDGDFGGINYPAAPVPGTSSPAAKIEILDNGLVLLANGEVLNLRLSPSVETNLPDQLSGVVDIAVGDQFALALKADGTVQGWGKNNLGQIDIPEGLDRVIAVAATHQYSLALQSDGTLVAWGTVDAVAEIPVLRNDVVAMSAWFSSGALLHRDGTVSSWGLLQRPLEALREVVQLSVGPSATAAVFENGLVGSWDHTSGDYPNDPFSGLTDIVGLSQGNSGGLAVDSHGSVTRWNYQGTLTNDLPPEIANVVKVSTGRSFAAIVRAPVPEIVNVSSDQSLTAKRELVLSVDWAGAGAVEFDWMRDGESLTLNDRITVDVDGTLRIKNIESSEAGEYTVVVSNVTGAATSLAVTVSVLSRPEPIEWPTDRIAILGETLEVDLTSLEEGTTYEWYFNGVLAPEITGAVLRIEDPDFDKVGHYRARLTGSEGGEVWVGFRIDVVAPDAQVFGWGDLTSVPTILPEGLSNIVQFAVGGSHLLLLKRDGGVLALGDNTYGQTEVPADLQNVVQIAAGNRHSLALLADGSVVQWGEHLFQPQDVPDDLPPIASIKAGASISVALSAEGSVFWWGGSTAEGPDLSALPRSTQIATFAGVANFGMVFVDGTLWEYDLAIGHRAYPATEAQNDIIYFAGRGDDRIAIKRNGTAVVWDESSTDSSIVSNVAEGAAYRVDYGSVGSIMLRDASFRVFPEDLSELGMPPVGFDEVYQMYRYGTGNFALMPSPTEELRWLEHPHSLSFTPDESIVLAAELAESDGVSFQWYLDDVALENQGEISGATSARLTISRASQFFDGRYSLVATRGNEQIETVPVSVNTVASDSAPTFVSRPLTRIAAAGDDVTFTAELQNATRYQWRHNREIIPGQQEASMTLNGVSRDHAGYYELWAENESGSATHTRFYLSVSTDDLAVVSVSENGAEAYQVPNDIGSVAAIHAVYQTNIVLRADGSVRAWGEAPRDLLDEINALSEIAYLAPTSSGGLAITADGAMVGWGTAREFAEEFSDERQIIAASMAGGWAVILFADGSLYSRLLYLDTPLPIPADLHQVVAVTTSIDYATALNSDGSLVSWDPFLERAVTVPREMSNVLRIESGQFFLLGQRGDGTLARWYYDRSELTDIIGLSGAVRDFSVHARIGVARLDGSASVHSPSGVDTDLFDLYYGVHDIDAGSPNWLALVSVIAPTIEAQPSDVVVDLGESGVMTVLASGEGELKYQWLFEGDPLVEGEGVSGTRTSTLTIENVDESDIGAYGVVVFDDNGGTRSSTATLWLSVPQVLAAPHHSLMLAGGDFELSSEILVAPGIPFSAQWYEGVSGDTSNPIEGATGTALDLSGRTEVSSFWLRFSSGDVQTDFASSMVIPVSPVDLDSGPIGSATIGHANSRLFIFGATGSALSDDGGETWTESNHTVASPGAVAFGDGLYLHANGAGVWESSDGLNWTQGSFQSPAEDVAFGDGAWVVRSNDQQIHWRDEQGVWQLHQRGFRPTFFSFGPEGWLGVPRGNNFLLDSDDGLSWSYRETPTEIGRILGLGVFDDRYHVFGKNYLDGTGRLMSSSDGIEWELFETFLEDGPNSFEDRVIAVGHGIHLVAGGDRLSISDRGNNWQTHHEGLGAVENVVFEKGRFLIQNSDGRVYRSAAIPAPLDFSMLPQSVELEWGETLELQGPVPEYPTSLQWFLGESGDTSAPIAGAGEVTLVVSPTENTNYWVRSTSRFRQEDSGTIGVEVVVNPIEFLSTPETQVAQEGDSLTLSVTAAGTGPLLYRWYLNGLELEGQIESSLHLDSAEVGNGGRYEVEVRNAFETVRTSPAWLSVLPRGSSLSAMHSVSNPRYRPGDLIEVSSRLDYDASASSANWSVLLPSGWMFDEVLESSTPADSSPPAESTDLLEWSWTNLPAESLTFTYTLRVPPTQRGPVEITSLSEVTTDVGNVQLLAQPDPIALLPGLHSADTDGDFSLSLSELLRVIQLYNTRVGTTRTGRYLVSETGVDGFAPDQRDLDEGEIPSRFHRADTNHDGRLNLTELLRVIQIYNTREGTQRTGKYHADSSTVDGFAPGPDPADTE